MKTTEIFVEQLLIGLLASLAVVMLAAPDQLRAVKEIDLTTSLLLVAGAYLIGIIYDRYADTVLEDVERHQRLLTALDRWKKICESPKKDPATNFPQTDPFPEDRLRVTMLRSERLNEYGSYLRSRIRLMRALATLMPALSIGLVIVVVDPARRSAYGALPYVVLAAYAILFLVTLIGGTRLPRTEDLTNAKKYQQYWVSSGYSRGLSRGRAGARAAFRSRAMWMAMLLTIAATLIVWSIGPAKLALFPVLGFVAMLFIGWTWWRITKTFDRLLLAM